MIGSLWRYSHFFLALVSAIFIFIASITGSLLALEPISEASKSYVFQNLDAIYISDTIENLEHKFSEVLEIEVLANNSVKALVFTKDGISKNIYINPRTGDNLGDVPSRSTFFSFITNLHRSLFLKSIGRIFVGVASLLLCFIAVTGVFLIARRQGGFNKWYTKVQETDFAQRYHVIFGRLFLAPILIIATTGVYLSAEKFSLLPEPTLHANWKAISSDVLDEHIVLSPSVFESITLQELRKLTFPFSDDSNDYFELALNDRELLVHQYSGKVVSVLSYPFVQLASLWSAKLHTGQGNILWSVILLLASLSLLFFICSGFVMSFRRRSTKAIASDFTKDEAEYILLVGSETGNTFVFAKTFFKALKKEGKKVYMATLNQYTSYEKATCLIVFTSTYGDGDPPSNAHTFETLFNTITPKQNIKFSVLSFGSMLYPKYCYFGLKVDGLLHSSPYFTPIVPIVKIDDQSQSEFTQWILLWNKYTGMNLNSLKSKQNKKIISKDSFEVIQITPLNIDNTALLYLRPKTKTVFHSGDLIKITPPGDTHGRYYSIAKINNEILLSVKWHPKGVCSTYLCTLKQGDIFSGAIEKNPNFHFPKKAPSVLLVANGTGIAPYLGMLHEIKNKPVQLIWGGRVEASFDCYRTFFESTSSKAPMLKYELALSQIKDSQYVQDILLTKQIEIAQQLKKGGCIMLCGSLAMQYCVLDTLQQITTTQLNEQLSVFQNKGQLLLDCY
tara:strand:- start:54 stop:2246 length:2193 start_codon:yes stop_codon:yes gene_type:complete